MVTGLPPGVTASSEESASTTGTASTGSAGAEESENAGSAPPPQPDFSASTSSVSPLSLAAIVGLSVGCTLAGVILAILGFWLWRRRRTQQRAAAAQAASNSSDGKGEGSDGTGQTWEKQELDVSRVFYELDAGRQSAELEGKDVGVVREMAVGVEGKERRAELETREKIGELDGGRLERRG